ncbi:hypothetical protein KEM60_01269 [Austwickia sp. TVS 96-490-7B]|uniref:DUF1345 domain-containing protein n=1 Tax=Austwickia sp. TVS 96-490-7B TaxID=2830843 RepID=UPI001C59819E|nr:DUF1345 domain-containing protein [Austwickia sp. TVS 96-490-7B]MBW3085077.1 hypothetical protein [Austwickia sp. TVS 96-490-7B]
MPPTPTRRRHRRAWANVGIVVETTLAAVGLLVFLELPWIDALGLLLIWNLLAMLYLGIGVRLLDKGRRDGQDHLDDDPREHDRRSRRTAGLSSRFQASLRTVMPLLTSVLGLGASVSVVVLGQGKDADALAVKVVGGLTMVLAWLFLHTSYGLRYSLLYRQLGDAGLGFSHIDHPRTVDFMYFSFTVGTTFATSDVDVNRRRMRWVVMGHSVIAFFYNAVVLAVAFKMLTGG